MLCDAGMIPSSGNPTKKHPEKNIPTQIFQGHRLVPRTYQLDPRHAGAQVGSTGLAVKPWSWQAVLQRSVRAGSMSMENLWNLEHWMLLRLVQELFKDPIFSFILQSSNAHWHVDRSRSESVLEHLSHRFMWCSWLKQYSMFRQQILEWELWEVSDSNQPTMWIMWSPTWRHVQYITRYYQQDGRNDQQSSATFLLLQLPVLRKKHSPLLTPSSYGQVFQPNFAWKWTETSKNWWNDTHRIVGYVP